MMPVWHVIAKQNTPNESYRVSVDDFEKIVVAFNEKYKVREESGVRSSIHLQEVIFIWQGQGSGSGPQSLSLRLASSTDFTSHPLRAAALRHGSMVSRSFPQSLM